jgi:hypothetical protein
MGLEADRLQLSDPTIVAVFEEELLPQPWLKTIPISRAVKKATWTNLDFIRSPFRCS